MPKTKHTPGPWRVEPWHYHGRAAVLTVCTDKDAIARICDLWCMDERTAERDANAALIAAAPETAAERDRLRAALEKIKDARIGWASDEATVALANMSAASRESVNKDMLNVLKRVADPNQEVLDWISDVNAVIAKAEKAGGEYV